MNDIVAGLFLFLFFSTSAFNMDSLRKDAYLECVMNSHERTIVINGQTIHCGCGKFAICARFELVRVVGYCDEHSPKTEELKPTPKEEISFAKEFPQPPEPIKKTESDK